MTPGGFEIFRRKNRGLFPKRRIDYKIALPGYTENIEKMDHADPGLEGGA